MEVERAASQSTSQINTMHEMSDRSSGTHPPEAARLGMTRSGDECSTASNGDSLAGSTTERMPESPPNAMEGMGIPPPSDILLERLDREIDLNRCLIKQEHKLDAQTQRIDEISGILVCSRRCCRPPFLLPVPALIDDEGDEQMPPCAAA